MEEILKALGFKDEEVTKEKIDALKKALAGKWIPAERLSEEVEKNKKLAEDIKARDKQIGDLKKLEGLTEEQKTKIAELEETNKNSKKEYDASVKKLKLETALKTELKGKVQDVDLTLSLLDISKVEIDEEKGTIKSGFAEQFTNLKKEKPFLFIEEKKDDKQGGGTKVFKPAGAKPKDGDDAGGGDDTAAVKFAKERAAAGVGNTADAEKKYFKV